MNHPSTRPGLARLVAIASAAALFLGTAASALGSPARAEEVVASDPGTTGSVVTAAAQAAGPRAVARGPRTIVVSGHGGQPVALFAEGMAPIRKPRPGGSPVSFTGLKPGVAYTVIVGRQSLGPVVALDRPAAATALVVRTAEAPDAVVLTWRHQASAATGGPAVTYTLSATSPTAPPVSAVVRGGRSGRLEGLDPSALYTFSVTPRNGAGSGTASSARMTRPLAAVMGVPTTAPAPAPSAPAPSPAPTAPSIAVTPATTTPEPAPVPAAPAAPAAPATKVIYVCPDGFPESSAGLCQKTTPYTYETMAYTTHVEDVYGYGQTGWNYAWGYCSGSGTSGNWANGDPYCRTAVYGDGAVVGTRVVRDATPAGWTDTGTNWQRRNPAPDGHLDDGTQWVRTVPKEARTVAA
ncbi:MAG: fibronectin type III domain-containing protein [Candidatus Nanopelagicales bacterium]